MVKIRVQTRSLRPCFLIRRAFHGSRWALPMGGSHRDPRCKGDVNGGGVAGWLRLWTRDAVRARAGYPPPRPSPLPAAAGGSCSQLPAAPPLYTTARGHRELPYLSRHRLLAIPHPPPPASDQRRTKGHQCLCLRLEENSGATHTPELPMGSGQDRILAQHLSHPILLPSFPLS